MIDVDMLYGQVEVINLHYCVRMHIL